MKMTEGLNHIVRFFEWWNDAMVDESRLTEAAFRGHFTDDGELIVNGNLRARGPAELAAHYRRIKASVESVSMALPVELAAQAGDIDFTHCYCNVSASGETKALEAMAYAEIASGKIRRMRVLSL